MAKKKKAAKAKKTKKGCKSKKCSKKEVLVVASKVKAYMKAKNMNTSADAIQALSDKVYCLLDTATERTKANNRKTVKPQDV